MDVTNYQSAADIASALDKPRKQGKELEGLLSCTR